MGLGLVGCGRFGAFCLTAFSTIPNLKLIGVADQDQARAKATAAAYTVAAFEDYAALLGDPAVQVVAINTPPAFHAPMALAAIAAGKHVFCEKPLALSTEDASSVLRAARDAGVRVSVDYVMRWNPLYGLLDRLQSAKLTNSPLLGPLRRFALENYAADLPANHWFWDEAVSGGIFVEHGVHFFDVCAWLMRSQPRAVQGLEQRRSGGAVDTVAATCVHPDGATATYFHAFTHPDPAEYQAISLDWGSAHGRLTGWIPLTLDLEISTDDHGPTALEAIRRTLSEASPYPLAGEGRGGGLQIQVETNGLVRVRASLGGSDAKECVYRESIRAGMVDLLAAIEENRSPTVTGIDAWHSLATAAAAQSAARSGQTIVPLALPADLSP